MNKKYNTLLKINQTLIFLALTQCDPQNISKQTQTAEIKETRRLAQYHFVQKGDTLPTVAQKYKMSKEELIYLNQLNSEKKLYPGQRLHVHKREFDSYQKIPIVETKFKPNAYNDYNVDKKRTTASAEHYKTHKSSYDKTKGVFLLPVLGLAALGAGALKLAKGAKNTLPTFNKGPFATPTFSNQSTQSVPYAFPDANTSPNSNNLPKVPMSPRAEKNSFTDQNTDTVDLPSVSVGENSPPTSHPTIISKSTNTPPYAGPLENSVVEAATNTIPRGGSTSKSKLLMALGGGGGAIGLGLLGLKSLVANNPFTKNKVIGESPYECVRVAFGWPLNHQSRIFSYIDARNKEAGIRIKNTHRELFVVPAFPGQIIDVQKPDESSDRYIIIIKHKCNNLTTMYGNIRIPSEETLKPENLKGIYVTKANAIGLIDPDQELFFAVKQIQAGKHAEKVNFEFQNIVKHEARIIPFNKCNGNINLGGLKLSVSSSGPKRHKILSINGNHVSEIYFIDPLIYLPRVPLGLL